ncbi:MAG: PAS domain S-box protein [Candidatus Heimdallarchaeaceae archaeon]
MFKILYFTSTPEQLPRVKSLVERELNDITFEFSCSTHETLKQLENCQCDILVYDALYSVDEFLNLLQKLKENENSVRIILPVNKNNEEIINKVKDDDKIIFVPKFTEIGSHELVIVKTIKNVVSLMKKEEKTINELLKVREALEESELRYRTIVENAQSGIAILDSNFKFVYVNDKVCEYSGFNYDELIGRDFRTLLPPETAKLVENRYVKRQKGKKVIPTYEINFIHKSGKKRIVEIRSSIVTNPEGSPYTISQILDKTEEKRFLEFQRFIHTILRHDVRNKSQLLMGYIYLLKDLDPPAEFLDLLHKMEQVTIDFTQVLNQIKTLIDISEDEELQKLYLPVIISTTISNINKILERKGIELEYEVQEIYVLTGSLIKQVFVNLLNNSIFHSNCKKIRIYSEIVDREYVLVVLEDDGIGIPDDMKTKIFSKSSKGKDSRGLGLGLYIAKTLIENYGGSICVKDAEFAPSGARFEIKLRIAQ